MEENTASLVARPLELQNESISNTANSTPTPELGPTPMVDEVLEMELPTSTEPVIKFHTCSRTADVTLDQALEDLMLANRTWPEDGCVTAFNAWIHSQLREAAKTYNTI